MNGTREAAVAGMFYPEDAGELRAAVESYVAQASDVAWEGDLRALIAPHAGYPYSGPVAGAAYALLQRLALPITRVVVMGPSHRVPFRGVAGCHADVFETPLGPVPVDQSAMESLLDLPGMHQLDEAHRLEHGLEVHLPFLQVTLDSFSIVPLVVGDAALDEVAAVLERLEAEPGTFLVISSDLSHFYDYETARRMDDATSKAIEALDPDAIGYEQACGRIPIQGLLTLARARGWRARTLDLRNSGDTAGSRDSVVGYGAYAIG